MEERPDLFVKYTRKNGLILKTEDGNLLQMDYVSTHMQMKKQANSVRSVFRETGIETLWQQRKGTMGNIASATMEFVFKDGVSFKHPIGALNDKDYFTTITADEIVQNQPLFKKYLSTYKGQDLAPVFSNIGKSIGFYTDTEVQILSYLFFKDLYYRILNCTLQERAKPLQERFYASIDGCFTNKVLKKEQETIDKIQKDIMPFLLGSLVFKQSVDNLNSALNPKLQTPIWMQIENVLTTVRKTKDLSIFIPFVARDLISVVLHIYTELDPCQNCRYLLSNLSKKMNAEKCNPGIFLKKSSLLSYELPLPNARFITVVSSSLSYPDNDLRNTQAVYDGGTINLIENQISTCIYMPIDNLQFSISIVPQIFNQDISSYVSQDGVTDPFVSKFTVWIRKLL
jgi:hypothetical protein